jgi:hypothetical protein
MAIPYPPYNAVNNPFPLAPQPPPSVIEKVGKLVIDARHLFDQGDFGMLDQAKFFRAIADALAPEAPSGDNHATTPTDT